MARYGWKRMLIVAWLVTACAGRVCAAGRPTAQFALKSGQRMDVELVVRSTEEMVSVRRVDSGGLMTIPVSEITAVAFNLDLGRTNLGYLYRNEKYKETGEILEKALQPVYRFIDLPNNNGLPYLQYLIKCLFWEGEYKKVTLLCDLLADKRAVPDPVQDWARIFKALSALEQGDLAGAAGMIEKVSPPDYSADTYGPYYYALAQVRMAEGKISEGQENAASVVVSQAKNPEWFPAGLYISAKGYGYAKRFDVAKQIIDEINLLFPDSRWSVMAGKLSAELKDLPLQVKTAASGTAQKEEPRKVEQKAEDKPEKIEE
ncbi:MAG: hypothetical protein JXR37_19625 [Kiritimatiellae bacterium]|nr:hypothetical protein [Kiritimatiellia bacterium]